MNKNYHIFFCLVFLMGCGGGGSSSELSEEINNAPKLIGLSDFAIDENTSEITIVQATDAEGDTITYSISGSDSALMTIGSTSGQLSFITSRDYENPEDSDLDNIYRVSVNASDGKLSTALGIKISINGVLEGMGGSNMLLMGNSFFRPYAQRLGELALDADFLEHNDTAVFRGGDNGTPIGLWNNEDTNTGIKQILDGGSIDMLGMTGHYNETKPISGFSEWIDYALQKNPDIKVFISIPPIDSPANWQQRAEDAGYNNIREVYDIFVNSHTHKVVIEPLREMYSSTEIFSIPTGWAAFDLVDQYDDGALLDEISLFGSFDNAIFTDDKGHLGKVVIDTAAVMWLHAIYGVNLRINQFNTGFNTDLHTIAENIIDLHDPAYKQE